MRASAMLTVLAVLFAGCADGVDAASGAGSALQVAGAQYFLGHPPEATDGPRVHSLESRNNRVPAGFRNGNLSGHVDDATRAVLIWKEGDPGYWGLVAGVSDPFDPGSRTFDATVGFVRGTPAGTVKLQVQAVGQTPDHVGPPSPFNFVVRDIAATAADSNMLVLLEWDADADLDLHLSMPNPQADPTLPTLEVWARNPTSYRPTPDETPDAAKEAVKNAAVLDFDSNTQCVIDGLRAESISMKAIPPRGHYVVRVDTPSLCGLAAARWHVRVFLHGDMLFEARGVASSVDGYPAQGDDLPFGQDERPGTNGAGVVATQFDVY